MKRAKPVLSARLNGTGKAVEAYLYGSVSGIPAGKAGFVSRNFLFALNIEFDVIYT